MCQMVDVPAEEVLAGKPRLVVLCDQVRDPGNLGTVIRCADGFGAMLLWSAGTPSMSTTRRPYARLSEVFSICRLLLRSAWVKPVQGAATRPPGLRHRRRAPCTITSSHDQGELARPTLWVLGNEAWGLPPATPRCWTGWSPADLRACREPQPLDRRSRLPVRPPPPTPQSDV